VRDLIALGIPLACLWLCGVAGATQVAVSNAQSCAVLPSGHVECWGGGPLGNGTAGPSPAPVEVQGVSNATGVATGGSYSCALLSSGHVECWGSNFSGELGDGTTKSSTTPVEALGVTDATQVAAGPQHACAVLSTAHVDCWGVPGHFFNSAYTTPSEIPGVSAAIQVTAAFFYSCALLSDGHVVCWGEADTPVEVHGLADVIQITSGWFHSCALLSDGHVDCWGENESGQLGDGTTTESKTAVEVHDLSQVTLISAGAWDSCALLSGGDADCWGNNEYGQLGNGHVGGRAVVPVEVEDLSDATQIAAGGDHSCAVVPGGGVVCWGNNHSDQLGIGAGGGDAYTPVEVRGVSDGSQVEAADAHGCALLSTGRVDCWGENVFAALGDGGWESSDVPVEATGVADATQIATSETGSCAVLSSGDIECWGREHAPPPGEVDEEAPKVPAQVAGVSGAAEIAIADYDDCALLRSGRVDCWGGGARGELGDGKTESSPTPVEVNGITTAAQVATGEGHSCTVLTSGHVECWGFNGSGELGDGSRSESDVPVEVLGLTDATEVAAGGQHTCALVRSGHVYCWGDAAEGQLGEREGTPYERCEEGSGGVCKTTPVEVQSVSDAIAVAAGEDYSCALLSTGHVDCWGYDEDGQLGDGAGGCESGVCEHSDTPVEVDGVATATQISTGAGTTCATLSSGQLECWGSDQNGALGDGLAWSSTPVEVVGLFPASPAGVAFPIEQSSPTSEQAVLHSLGVARSATPSHASLLSVSVTASRKGGLHVKLSCSRNATTCAGTISVRIVERRGGHRRRTVVLAGAHYKLEPGRTATITLTLTPLGRKLLADRHTLHTTVNVTTSSGAAQIQRTSELTIRLG
jgi:alpha-tubulin suppressor-like RCC1 family protein